MPEIILIYSPKHNPEKPKENHMPGPSHCAFNIGFYGMEEGINSILNSMAQGYRPQDQSAKTVRMVADQDARDALRDGILLSAMIKKMPNSVIDIYLDKHCNQCQCSAGCPAHAEIARYETFTAQRIPLKSLEDVLEILKRK